jgi:mycofactocin precursor peptide peptidase
MSRLDCLTWPEVGSPDAGAAKGATLLVPVGSTEQHGPHLPLTTDTDIAVAVSLAAAERDPQLLVAPALPYGSSGEHQAFPGTLSIGAEAIELVLLELCRSATVGFGSIVLVTAHGGNAEPLARAVARLRAEGRAVTAWSPQWGGDLHAGRTETSLMLAIAPDRVHLEHATPGDQRPIEVLLPILREHGVGSVSANGVLGDPTGATAEEGHRLLSAAADRLVSAARAFTEQSGAFSHDHSTMEVHQ